MRTIEMQTVESSQIHSIGYDAVTQTLAIRFRGKAGAPAGLYHYSQFSAENYAAFACTESLGKHFYRYIKPFPERFPCVCIERMPAPAAA
ncbi:KTSC domain-containing protein [Burkholderia contaminans]|uniref:KTSC domain-containing protein n=1 Tax=Burkholderia contaminans TaxID=488447 RepID=UPI001453D77C|nr:KTSC domain-containing protein [Burkholderia contaminans]VWD20406.1 hypothetical protein BCO18442_03874 [Burkholderia contaminans]